ncbi:FAD-dependent oxidoreductase, partial [Desulfocurvibacter africanus]|uniref:FAD-dependent oxidoreductase n=1 Tax=Desulfocurvibacter africanus TaxID=873 RepID=UPI002FDA8AA9
RLCPAPCETICRRNIADEGVAIHTLHRFVADWEMNSGTRVKLDCNPCSGHRVAIIGGGPAGLSCAYFLRRIGHEPVIFEKREKVGGMLTGVIPEYRLPDKVVNWEVQTILDLGVEVRSGVEFGKDITLKDLEEQGFEAVFIATGAWKVPGLKAKNADAEGVVTSISFLSAIHKSITDLRGKQVVVVGDTNTAMDVISSAARLGADTMALIPCIRRKMSANKNDVTRAAEQGGKLMFMTEPVNVLAENGKVFGVEYRTLQYDDPEKAAGKPKPVEGSEATIKADLIVIATDRLVDTAPFTGENGEAILELDKKTGGIKADATTLQTSIPNVFVGGEAHTGRNILIQAVADGRRAARSIHHFITEKTIPEPVHPQLGVIPESILKNMEVVYTIPRIKVPEISVEERRCTFKEEVKGSITFEAARKEGSRCLRCGLTCYDSYAGADYAADTDVRKFSKAAKEQRT